MNKLNGFRAGTRVDLNPFPRYNWFREGQKTSRFKAFLSKFSEKTEEKEAKMENFEQFTHADTRILENSQFLGYVSGEKEVSEAKRGALKSNIDYIDTAISMNSNRYPRFTARLQREKEYLQEQLESM